jgi:hypothetical protein
MLTHYSFNFLVVEITPYGIQSLHWKFYIIWLVFNASFVPMVYFLYPETAGRSLEDIEEYYRHDPPLLVWRDKEATRAGRPERYSQKEEEEMRRNSGADLGALRRGSKISNQWVSRDAQRANSDYDGKTEHGDMEEERKEI